jgi:hypothetical protein
VNTDAGERIDMILADAPPPNCAPQLYGRATFVAALASGRLDGRSINCFSPVSDVRLRARGDPLDEHDFATRYALQAPELRKLVHLGEMSVQSEA